MEGQHNFGLSSALNLPHELQATIFDSFLRGTDFFGDFWVIIKERPLGYQAPATTAFLFRCYFLVNRVGQNDLEKRG